MALSFWGHMCTLSVCYLFSGGIETGVLTFVFRFLLFFSFFFLNFIRQRIYLFISTSGVHTLKDREKKRNNKAYIYYYSER